MAKTELTFDFKEFDKLFKQKAIEFIPELAEIGMGRASFQLLNDAIMEEPTVPHREGFLRGSGSIFVNNKFKGKSSQGDNSLVNSEHHESINEENEIIGIVGFNTPYAERWHEADEGSVHFTEASAGVKFLEKKMNENRKLYYKIIANQIIKGQD